MALSRNIVRLIEALRLAWPAGRTVDDLARGLDVQPWRAAELATRCEELRLPLERTGAGLRLDPAAMPLLGELIEWTLGTRRVGGSVLVFERTASTNDVAWQAARRRESDGLIVLAETQSAGRGRFGRVWLDRPGASLLFSLLLLDVAERDGLANRLVMAASVALAEAIESATGVSAAVRWPNDLYVHGRKLAGILLESRPGQGGVDVVLGAGVNCNQSPADFPPAIARTATSLAAELGHAVDRTGLMREMLRRLEHWLIDAADAPDALHRAYLSRMDHSATRVRVHRGGQTIDATVRDVDPMTGLIVELPAGGVAHFAPSDVTLEWIA